MYTEFALTAVRPSTEALSKNLKSTSDKKSSWIFVILTLAVFTVTTAAMAGPSQSKLAGGNGIANGR